MSKLFSLFCLIALAATAAAMPEANKASSGSPRLLLPLPGSYPWYGPADTLVLEQPTYAQIGEVVRKVPTAVSHQSQTVVHNSADVVTPIVAPAVRTQVLRSYNAPLVYSTL